MFEIGRLARLEIGYVGETGSRVIEVDVTEWLERFPGAAIAVNVEKPNGKFYLAATEVEDGVLKWTATESDVEVAGRGKAQFTAFSFETKRVYKSRMVETIIKASIDETVDPDAPDPFDTWVAHAVEAKEGALSAAAAAEKSASEADGFSVQAAEHAKAAQEAESESKAAATVAGEYATEAGDHAKAAQEAEFESKDASTLAGEYAAQAGEQVELARGEAEMAAENAAKAEEHAQEAQSAATDADVSAKESESYAGASQQAASVSYENAQLAESYAREAETIIKTTPPAIQQEAAGSLLTLNDAAARPALALVSKLTAVQSGTGDPSPDNVRPITGHDVVSLFRTGKNMLGFKDYLVNGSSFDESCENGVFHRTVTAAHATSYVTGTTGMQYIENPFIPAGTYTFTLTHLSGVSLISPYLEVTLPDGSTVQLPNGKATTIAQSGTITGVRMTSKNFSTGDEFSYTLQLESGAGTEYEGYDGVILSADLPETVYGGALDWLTGVLTVTHRKLVIDGETVAIGKVSMNVNNVYYATLMLDKAHNGVISTNKQDGIISSHYVENPLVAAGNCYITGAYGDVLVVVPHNQTLTTPELLNAYYQTNPVTFVYKLAEPYDVQLTPQQLELLKGCNTVWSSTGATEVSYIADTKSYIDNAIAAIAASIINV